MTHGDWSVSYMWHVWLMCLSPHSFSHTEERWRPFIEYYELGSAHVCLNANVQSNYNTEINKGLANEKNTNLTSLKVQ